MDELNMYQKVFSVITPYYKEDLDVITKSIDSVERQTPTDLSVKHYLVADGFPMDLNNKNIIHLPLPTNHSDFGDTPRMMGATLAVRQGCYGLMFLDADNTLCPTHIQDAYHSHLKTGADIIICRRNIFSADGQALTYPNTDKTLEHVDTGCLVFFREAIYDALEWIKIPREYSVIGDRYFWNMIKAKKRVMAVLRTPTVNYTSHFATHYSASGLPAPEDAKKLNFTDLNQFNKTLKPEEKSTLIHRLFGKAPESK